MWKKRIILESSRKLANRLMEVNLIVSNKQHKKVSPLLYDVLRFDRLSFRTGYRLPVRTGYIRLDKPSVRTGYIRFDILPCRTNYIRFDRLSVRTGYIRVDRLPVRRGNIRMINCQVGQVIYALIDCQLRQVR
jgi:hypothetical protein